jgi:hypothetical protein
MTLASGKSRMGFLLLTGCIFLTGCFGCISRAQKEILQKWYTAYYEVQRERQSKAAPVPANLLVAKIGEPDYVVKGSEFAVVFPDPKVRHFLITLSALDLAGLTIEQEPPQSAIEAITQASVWFYDEAARYPMPAQPDSFWGMGTGFQVIWFVVNGKGDVIAQEAGGFATPIAPSHRKK